MTYEIIITALEGNLYQVDVKVFAEDGTELLQGHTQVYVSEDSMYDADDNQIFETQEAVAYDYAENVFLDDLRKKNRKIRKLVLPKDGE